MKHEVFKCFPRSQSKFVSADDSGTLTPRTTKLELKIYASWNRFWFLIRNSFLFSKDTQSFILPFMEIKTSHRYWQPRFVFWKRRMRRKELCKVLSYIYSSEHTLQILTWDYERKRCWTSSLDTGGFSRKTGMVHQGQGWKSLDICL